MAGRLGNVAIHRAGVVATWISSKKVLRVLDVLRAAKVRTGIVFHDVEPYGGKRPIDKLRRAVQLYVMRQAVRRCDLAICTIPLEKISWLPKNVANATFYSCGEQIFLYWEQDQSEKKPANQAPTVAVYGVTDGSAGEEEMKLIAGSIRLAAARTGKLKLVVTAGEVRGRPKRN